MKNISYGCVSFGIQPIRLKICYRWYCKVDGETHFKGWSFRRNTAMRRALKYAILTNKLAQL